MTHDIVLEGFWRSYWPVLAHVSDLYWCSQLWMFLQEISLQTNHHDWRDHHTYMEICFRSFNIGSIISPHVPLVSVSKVGPYVIPGIAIPTRLNTTWAMALLAAAVELVNTFPSASCTWIPTCKSNISQWGLILKKMKVRCKKKKEKKKSVAFCDAQSSGFEPYTTKIGTYYNTALYNTIKYNTVLKDACFKITTKNLPLSTLM